MRGWGVRIARWWVAEEAGALAEMSDSGCRGWEKMDYFMTKSEITMR